MTSTNTIIADLVDEANELRTQRDELLSASRKAILALAHAASKSIWYQGAYEELSAVIEKHQEIGK